MTRQPIDRRPIPQARRVVPDGLEEPEPERSRVNGPLILFLVVGLVAAVAFVGYAITVRDALQVPLLATSSLVLGIVLGAWAVSGAVATLRASRQDRGRRALGFALLGGLFAMAAFGALCAALIFAMVWRPAA